MELIILDEAVKILNSQQNELLVSEIDLGVRKSAGFRRIKKDDVMNIVKRAKTLVKCNDVFVPYIQAYDHDQNPKSIQPVGRSWDILLNPVQMEMV